ncbi:MAG: hypothetical protein ACO3QB_13605 [bacterium]
MASGALAACRRLCSASCRTEKTRGATSPTECSVENHPILRLHPDLRGCGLLALRRGLVVVRKVPDGSYGNWRPFIYRSALGRGAHISVSLV